MPEKIEPIEKRPEEWKKELPPERQRFCNNGLALEFIPEKGAADGR